MQPFNWHEKLAEHDISTTRKPHHTHMIACIEYEASWGTRLDDMLYASNQQSADKFVAEFMSFSDSLPVIEGYYYRMEVQRI